jgi:hypothetical protein
MFICIINPSHVYYSKYHVLQPNGLNLQPVSLKLVTLINKNDTVFALKVRGIFYEL